MVLGGTEVHLGQAGRVRIVDQHSLTSEPITEQLLGVHSDPRRVQIRDHWDAAVHDGGGYGDADRTVTELVGELLDDLSHHVRAGLRGGLLRGWDAETVRTQGTGREVDGGTLDAGSADVNTEYRLGC